MPSMISTTENISRTNWQRFHHSKIEINRNQRINEASILKKNKRCCYRERADAKVCIQWDATLTIQKKELCRCLIDAIHLRPPFPLMHMVHTERTMTVFFWIGPIPAEAGNLICLVGGLERQCTVWYDSTIVVRNVKGIEMGEGLVRRL